MSASHPFAVLLIILLLGCAQETETQANKPDTQTTQDEGISIADGGTIIREDVGGSTIPDLGMSDVGGLEQDFMLPASSGCEP